MFFILAVILIAIAGILCILFFDEKPKAASEQKLDKRAIPSDPNTISSDEVKIVFDEPIDIRHINILLNLNGKEEKITSEELEQNIEISPSDNNDALTTNSKINPFNF